MRSIAGFQESIEANKEDVKAHSASGVHRVPTQDGQQDIRG